ncbi:MAG TPA: xanthine dehydrogenase family protein molybdopterin-binding subunit [Vicinamibacterales bacterium]|nr:xanthine dehydrogenase family protein molybdopterin-binding subunit [Vicinamibacterales bacterium]
MAQEKPAAPPVIPPVPKSFKLLGQNYVTPDLVAKVTGRAKYAEDFRADGMVFVKLMPSPRPHARVVSIDASAALAMPGVHGILTADDLPAAPAPAGPPAAAPPAKKGEAPAAKADAPPAKKADSTDNPPPPKKASGAAAGAVVGVQGAPPPAGTPTSPAAAPAPAPTAPPMPAEFALTKEPVYEGEPILAVAADTEELASEAIDRIVVTFEALPHVIDPIEGLRPGSPNGRTEGNVFVGPSMRTLKWTAADMEEIEAGRFPVNAEAAETLLFGDVEQGFKEADLVVERIMHQQTTSHQPMESRSAMAYWQNGKCYLHISTQSLARSVASVAGWVGVKPDELVLISEYTGGGFGSKIPGAQTMAIPALMSKKLNGRPVMMRVSRAEETYIGRVRPGYQGWIKMGFKKDGRVTAIDTFIVEASGPYRRQGDHGTTANLGSLLFQAPNMRFRGISVATNTPPGVSQRAPGGLQASVWFEPLVHEASKKLGIDQVAIHMINAPEGQAQFGLVPPNTPPGRPRNKLTSCFVKECLTKGAEMFNWETRKAVSGQRTGSKVKGVGVGIGAYTAGSIGVDGLCILRPDGKLEIHQGVGNLGTHSTFDTARVICEVSGFPWEQTEVVWGNTSKGLPWSSIQAGSQTTYAHTRANYATGMDFKKKLTEIAAKSSGGSPESYDTNARGVIRKGGGVVMTWAQAAERAIKLGGIYDGSELPKEINAMTRAAATAHKGRGLMGVARDNLPRDGQTYGFMSAFAEVEVDVETGVWTITDFVGVADVGTVIHPASLSGQMLGGGIQGIGHVRSQKLVYDPHYGAGLATRMHHNKPPTILDIPKNSQWAAVGLPDPTNPIGAKGIGEPSTVAAAGAVLNALADAIGDDIIRRTPVQPEMIMATLANNRQIAYETLTAFI